MLTDFICEGHFERHLRRSRTRNATRREALLEALATSLGRRVEVSGANAGMHLLVWLRDVAPAASRDVDRPCGPGRSRSLFHYAVLSHSPHNRLDSCWAIPLP